MFFRLDSLEHDAFFAGKEFTLWNKLEGKEEENRMTSCNKYLEYPKEMDLHKEDVLLLVSMKYVKENHKLDVCVKQVRNLPVSHAKGKLDHSYATVSLKHNGKVVKKMKTSVVKHDRNPVFNKNVTFDIQGLMFLFFCFSYHILFLVISGVRFPAIVFLPTHTHRRS